MKSQKSDDVTLVIIKVEAQSFTAVTRRTLRALPLSNTIDITK